MHFFTPLIFITSLLLIGCASDMKRPAEGENSSKPAERHHSIDEKLKNRREIRDAFQDYLKYSDKNDKNRLPTLNRLAEIEFEIGNLLLDKNDNTDSTPNKTTRELYDSQLDKTIDLFKLMLREYPRAVNNDDVLYQISRLHYLKNNHAQSIQMLHTLIEKYPSSPHLNEALFRLGEDYYTRKDYQQAELTYTKIISAHNKDEFYEKSLFKRGWARFKTQKYDSAIDDFMDATSYHNFSDTNKNISSENELFKEYFRSIAISFSYIGDITTISSYFNRHPDFQHISHTYSVISDVYHKQQRYIDASNIIKHFISNYPESDDAPHAHLKMISILQEGNFTNKINDEIENLYQAYRPDSKYWSRSKANIKHTKSIQASLRYYMLLISSHFHSKYQSYKKEPDFLAAKLWYTRFLTHYNAHAHRGNVYYLYAELLASHKNYAEAVKYYELAAYDRDLVLNKDAAYATIVLTNRLYNSSASEDKNTWLDKHIRYSFLFYQMYPDHEHADKTVLHAAELAYASKKYGDAIKLAELLTDSTNSQVTYDANIIKAPAYFNLEKYSDAEVIYTEIINHKLFKPINSKKTLDRLALCIYRQAEKESRNGNVDLAAHHFLRIYDITSQSDIAPTAMYDAIALFMSNKMWLDAISTIKKFQSSYPGHEKNNDVTKKLSVAYLNSNQDLKAAQEFEKISGFEKDRSLKMAALWQAAEIYETKNHLPAAVRSFSKYVDLYPRPYPQYVEAMNKLSILHAAMGSDDLSNRWLQQIADIDKKTPGSQKTDRTKTLASSASLSLARNINNDFNTISLVEPLKTNLGKKKKAMQKAIKLYGQSSTYGFQDITTEATYAIAEIYNQFSKSLLESERPKGLNQDELEQYEILLEDQAFPFEEKSIEFFEANLAHTKDGIYNKWIQKSHSRLKAIFPVRYLREEKAEAYVNVIH